MKSLLLTRAHWFLPLIVVLVTVFVYVPGLYGDFEFDDSVNILDNSAIRITTLSGDSILTAATSGKSGPFGRSISMLSFAGNYYVTEFEPFFFKLTNLLIHISAGLGVYVLVRQLTLALDKSLGHPQGFSKANLVALTTAGIWLVHPLNVTSVLYVVQRMTSLAALFTFLALALYVLGRRKSLEGHHVKGILLILISLGPMTGLALMSKENGALTPYLMLLLELVVFKFVSTSKGIRFFLYALFSAIVLIPAVMMVVNFDRLASYVASGYLQREFSLVDRLITQPQVLMFYLRLLVLPNAGVMGIYHDDFPISSSLTESFSALISAGTIFALIVIGIYAVRRAPALAIGVFWFLIAHSMESTFLALEMVHEHRNYLPIAGPIFAAAFYFWRSDFNAIAISAKWGIVVTIFAVFSAVTYVRSVQWSNLVDHTAIEVHNHPNSNRANYQMGRIYFKLYNNEKKMEMATLAKQYFERAAALGGSSIFPVTAMIQMAYKARTEPDHKWVEMAENRLQYGRAWEPNMVALNNLVNCQMTEYCKLTDSDMTSLLKAALANPDASRKTRGTAHSLLGGYYAVKLGNLELGTPHIKLAVEAEPDRIDYRLDLVRLYAASDNFSDARAELEAARKLDIWRLYTERFNAESALLVAAYKARAN